MKKADLEIHRGRVLHSYIKQHPRKIKDIVEDAGYKYGTFFKQIKKADLSYEIIAKYGKVIDKDFSEEFPEMNDYPSLTIISSTEVNQASGNLKLELNTLREKYTIFLNKHNLILEANIALREEIIELKEEISKLKKELLNKA